MARRRAAYRSLIQISTLYLDKLTNRSKQQDIPKRNKKGRIPRQKLGTQTRDYSVGSTNNF